MPFVWEKGLASPDMQWKEQKCGVMVTPMMLGMPAVCPSEENFSHPVSIDHHLLGSTPESLKQILLES